MAFKLTIGSLRPAGNGRPFPAPDGRPALQAAPGMGARLGPVAGAAVLSILVHLALVAPFWFGWWPFSSSLPLQEAIPIELVLLEPDVPDQETAPAEEEVTEIFPPEELLPEEPPIEEPPIEEPPVEDLAAEEAPLEEEPLEELPQEPVETAENEEPLEPDPLPEPIEEVAEVEVPEPAPVEENPLDESVTEDIAELTPEPIAEEPAPPEPVAPEPVVEEAPLIEEPPIVDPPIADPPVEVVETPTPADAPATVPELPVEPLETAEAAVGPLPPPPVPLRKPPEIAALDEPVIATTVAEEEPPVSAEPAPPVAAQAESPSEPAPDYLSQDQIQLADRDTFLERLENLKDEDFQARANPELWQVIHAVRAQMASCWFLDPNNPPASTMTVDFRLQLDRNGIVTKVEVQQVARMVNDKPFSRFARQARQAVISCSPFELPAEHFAIWQDFTMRFVPKHSGNAGGVPILIRSSNAQLTGGGVAAFQ
ncbi:MAG: hypothetical protein AAF530_19945 [Pseudomonadota bacterium]